SVGGEIGAAVDAVGLADAVAAAALRHRLALFNHARAVFLAGKWARAMGEHSTAGRECADANDAAEIDDRDLPPHPTPAPRPPRDAPARNGWRRRSMNAARCGPDSAPQPAPPPPQRPPQHGRAQVPLL